MIIIAIAVASLIDADAADGVSIAIVGSLETHIFVADRGVVVLGAGAVVPAVAMGKSEVCHLAKSEAAGVVTSVHISG